MFDNIFSLFITTVFTTLITVITTKLLNRWFDDVDDE